MFTVVWHACKTAKHLVNTWGGLMDYQFRGTVAWAPTVPHSSKTELCGRAHSIQSGFLLSQTVWTPCVEPAWLLNKPQYCCTVYLNQEATKAWFPGGNTILYIQYSWFILFHYCFPFNHVFFPCGRWLCTTVAPHGVHMLPGFSILPYNLFISIVSLSHGYKSPSLLLLFYNHHQLILLC